VTERIPRAAVVAGLGSALVLALRAPIDVGPRDAGELGAAAATLGVSHPTGAPFAMVLGHAASLLPLGSVAFRQSLAMAGCLGVAVGCAVVLALRASRGPARALVALAVASIALAPTLLRAGTMMEVYAPSLMLVALAWVAAERRALGWLGALSGLALSAHVTARLLVPLIALAPLAREVVSRRAARPLARPILAGVALAPLILEVPAAALRRPALGWGDPRTPGAFFRHFFASDIRESFSGRTVASHRLDDARALLDVVLLDAPLPTLLLAALGVGLAIHGLLRARELGLAIVAGCVAIDLAYALFVNPMGIVDRQVGHAALLGIAALAGRTIDRVCALPPPRAAPLVALAAALATTIGAWPRLAPELAGSEGRFVAETWTVPGALARVPPRALVICEADDLCGGSLYAQLVEGARPDVTVIPRPFLRAPTHLAHRLAGAPAAIEEARARGGRALMIDAGGEQPYPFPLQLDPAAPLVRAVTPDLPPAPPPPTRESPGPAARLLALDRALCGEGAALDACTPLTRHLLAQAQLGSIAPLIGLRRAGEAEALGTAAIALDPTMAAAWNDRAVARAELGRLDDALADLERALAIEPDRVAALSNRVLYLAVLGRTAEARDAIAPLRARCGDCVIARLYAAALDLREGGSRAPLDALREEAGRQGKGDAWCRAYAYVARVPPPERCLAAR
jgi:hypothetical protein